MGVVGCIQTCVCGLNYVYRCLGCGFGCLCPGKVCVRTCVCVWILLISCLKLDGLRPELVNVERGIVQGP